MLKYKLDPNDRHSDGYTPLHRACWGREARHSKFVKLLLKNGIDPDQKADNGKTCSDMTTNAETKKVIEKFKKKKEAAAKGEKKPKEDEEDDKKEEL